MATDAEPAEPGPGPAFRTSHITVPRTARVLTGGPPLHGAASLWFGFHGYGQLAEHLAHELRPITDHRHVVVPEGLSRFYLKAGRGPVGASWMTRADRDAEIADYVRYLDAVRDALEPGAVPLRLLGFSQGAATACRWAALSAGGPPDRVVLWGGAPPPDLDWAHAAARLAGTRFILVNGTADPAMPPATVAGAAERLRGHGLAAEVVWFDGGHHLHARTLTRIAAD